MDEDNLFRKTLKLTAVLLGATVVWVGGVSLVSVLAVSTALPSPGVTTPATPGPKPASSDGPSRSGPPSGPTKEDPPTKRRNG